MKQSRATYASHGAAFCHETAPGDVNVAHNRQIARFLQRNGSGRRICRPGLFRDAFHDVNEPRATFRPIGVVSHHAICCKALLDDKCVAGRAPSLPTRAASGAYGQFGLVNGMEKRRGSHSSPAFRGGALRGRASTNRTGDSSELPGGARSRVPACRTALHCSAAVCLSLPR